MKLIALKCPNCHGHLEVANGIDTFYCMYCGYKIMLHGQSREAIRAKVAVKNMEHTEKLVDKQHEQERYKMEFKKKDEHQSVATGLGILITVGLIVAAINIMGNIGVTKQEEKLQATLTEIMIDIDNGDFDSAYIKANTLYWDSGWTSEGSDKWNATRKAVIKEIDSAKKKWNDPSAEEEASDESGNWWSNLFN